DQREWTSLWNPLPKVVFATTLSDVRGNARLASGTVAEEIERLRAEPGEGGIAIGGATLATAAAEAGLIDEYRAIVYPVLVGGGLPIFPRRARRVELELAETRPFNGRSVYLRHGTRRCPARRPPGQGCRTIFPTWRRRASSSWARAASASGNAAATTGRPAPRRASSISSPKWAGVCIAEPISCALCR